MKRRICAFLAALLLFGAAASAAPAPLPEGMAYLAACRGGRDVCRDAGGV